MKEYVADLHVHSRFSYATSRDCDLSHLDRAAQETGVALVGTGDFTHPGWRQTLCRELEPAENGLYRLKPAHTLPCPVPGAVPPFFAVTGEISCVYRQDGRARRVHNLLVLPDLDAAERLSNRLAPFGNLGADGRPTLRLSCRDLLEITLETNAKAMLIPAHIFTPHFSMLGAFTDFPSVEACFSDLAGSVHALETGLSADPAMIGRISALDRFTLLSNSDAHSPGKLGREANRISGAPSYAGLLRAVSTGEGLAGTLEFFSEAGKYHLDGHRACGVFLTPAEAMQTDGLCPVCKKPLTRGVLHRVAALADRPAGSPESGKRPFQSLLPLVALVAGALGFGAGSKRAETVAQALLHALGPALFILLDAAPEDVSRVAGPRVAESLCRLRAGGVACKPGYDGVYGTIEFPHNT